MTEVGSSCRPCVAIFEGDPPAGPGYPMPVWSTRNPIAVGLACQELDPDADIKDLSQHEMWSHSVALYRGAPPQAANLAGVLTHPVSIQIVRRQYRRAPFCDAWVRSVLLALGVSCSANQSASAVWWKRYRPGGRLQSGPSSSAGRLTPYMVARLDEAVTALREAVEVERSWRGRLRELKPLLRRSKAAADKVLECIMDMQPKDGPGRSAAA